MGAICVFSLIGGKYFIIRIDNSNLKYINNFLFIEDRHELNNFLPEGVLNNEWLTKYNIIQLDFNKYYTSILNDLNDFPIVNAFDNFVDYDNGEINDYYLYQVEKLNDDYKYPINKYSLCYGKNIKGLNNIKIISVLKTSKLKESNSKEIIKSIYDDEILPVTMKKDIFNHIVGKYNKIKNETFHTSITTDINEALDTKMNYGGRIIPLEHRVSKTPVEGIR